MFFYFMIFFFIQVETVLFPDLKEKNLYLRSVGANETVVQDIIQKALNIVKANAIGPQKYIFFCLMIYKSQLHEI